MEVRQFEKLMLASAHFDAEWWKDDRRFWCAYCGIPTRRKMPAGTTQPLTLGTRDHVIPKAHKGGMITIPACRGCNVAKGTLSLPEYLDSEHFVATRKKRHKNQWPLHLLWAVAGVAALKRSMALATTNKPVTDKKQDPRPTTDHTR